METKEVMTLFKLINFSVLLLTLCSGSKANRYRTDTLTFHSEILHENRTILVFTPAILPEEDSLDILLMLDGEFSAEWYKAIQTDNKGSLIGVGIINTDRRRDLLPAFEIESFLNFLENEVLAAFSEKYRLNRRIIFGHSFGGTTVMYTLLHRPGLFDHYIASSAKPIMDMVECGEYQQADRTEGKRTIYLGYGSRDHYTVKKWYRRLQKNLNKCSMGNIGWEMDCYPGYRHNNSSFMTLENGLLRLQQYSQATSR